MTDAVLLFWLIPAPLGLLILKMVLHYRYYNEIIDTTGSYFFMGQNKHPDSKKELINSVSHALFKELLTPDFDPQYTRHNTPRTLRLARQIKTTLYALYGVLLVEAIGLFIALY